MQPEEGGAGLVAELHNFAVTGPLGGRPGALAITPNTEPSSQSTTGATPPGPTRPGGLLVPRRLAAMPGLRLSYGWATSTPGLSSAVPGVLARSLASDVWKLCAFQGPPSAV